MRLETLFEKFDHFADAPNAVAKMRELVLELAVQGKLVDQNTTEGSGHALLNLIQEKSPPSATDTEAEKVGAELPSFPSSWALSRLGEVAEIIRGVSFPGSAKSETRSNGDVACLRTASVQAEIDWADLIFIPPIHVSRSDQWVAPNDIIISMANSYALVGKVAIVRQVPQKATFGAFLAAIRPILIEPFFLLYVLRSPRMQAAFRASSSQTTNIANISLGRIRPLPFPLPPLAEQKRIVEKVDELMALCDRLEAQQQERETRHAALARASLGRFADAPSPANLHFLFHKSYTIPPTDLRKSILTLAVQGKLVPQDPNDEPISKSVGRSPAKSVVNELPMLPESWSYVRLKEVSERVSVAHVGPTSQYYCDKESGIPFLRSQNVRPKRLDLDGLRYITREFHKTLKKSQLREGDLLFVRVGANRGDCCRVPGGFADLNCANIVFARPQRDIVEYLELYCQSTLAKTMLSGMTTGSAQGVINTKSVAELLIPLPPFAEQRRIVAKVDQLMALVDELETQLAAARATAADLLEALVAELTAPAPTGRSRSLTD